MPDHRPRTLRIAEVIAETDDARTLVFDAEPNDRFDYRPGQFLTLRVPSERCGSVARCYSLSSAPGVDERLQVTVKRVAQGYASNWIYENVKAGDEIDVLPPAGVFTPKSLDDDLLLLAAGSGITPIMSILKSALAQGSGHVVLVYANADERSVIFHRELAELARKAPERLLVLHWLDTVHGLPAAESFRSLAPFSGYQAFLCGPEKFMAVGADALHGMGFSRHNLHIERFQSLAGNPFERLAKVAKRKPAVDAGTLTVTMQGEKKTLPWQQDQRMLDVLLDAGMDAPYSCRLGQCAACTCQIVTGEVRMENNEVLEEDDFAENFTLACQSLPVSEDVEITYDV
jgi:3-ketosteroid 9alpha-monooxygenase subunit B